MCHFKFADIDECSENLDSCSPDAQCMNTVGSFSCRCMTGYEGNGFECTGKFHY